MDAIKWLTVCLGCVVLSGCMSLGEPKVAYKDIGQPHSDTAIFAVQGFNPPQAGAPQTLSAVWRVDGRSMRNRLSMGSELPVWVRVLRGTHEFQISYGKVEDGTRKIGFATTTVADMQPRHVYFAKLHDLGDTFRIEVVDLGENSGFKEHVPPLQSRKFGEFPATF
jgi:hypothetical protein